MPLLPWPRQAPPRQAPPRQLHRTLIRTPGTEIHSCGGGGGQRMSGCSEDAALTFPRCKRMQVEGERHSIKSGTHERNGSLCLPHFRVEWAAGRRPLPLPNPGKRGGRHRMQASVHTLRLSTPLAETHSSPFARCFPLRERHKTPLGLLTCSLQ